MTIGLYARISQDRTGDEAGVTRQREDAEKLCAQRGWTDLQYFEDNDISATNGGPRPGYEALMSAVARGGIEKIVVWHLSRLWRNRRERAESIELLKRHRVSVVCCKGPEIDMATAYGRAIAGLLGEFDSMEVEIKSERTIRAVEQAALAGRRVGGRRPFGFEQDGMTLRPAEAQGIKDAYAAVLAGASLAGIARTLNMAGLTTGKVGYRSGKRTRWTHDTVRKMLMNPRYAGLRARHGEVVAPAKWPAIVPEETWRATLALLTDPDRNTGRKSGRQLLSGLAKCGVCGQLVHGGGASHKKPIYRCRSMKHINRLALPVDEWIGEAVIERLSRPDASDLLTDASSPASGLREELSVLRRRLDDVAVEFADGALSASQLRTINGRLGEKIAALESQLADTGRVNVLAPLVHAADVRQAWFDLGEGGHDRQSAVIRALMDIRLHPVGRGVRFFRPETLEVAWLV